MEKLRPSVSKPRQSFHATSFDKLSPEECELLLIHSALARADGDLCDAANYLGLDELTLQSKIGEYEVGFMAF